MADPHERHAQKGDSGRDRMIGCLRQHQLRQLALRRRCEGVEEEGGGAIHAEHAIGAVAQEIFVDTEERGKLKSPHSGLFGGRLPANDGLNTSSRL